MLTCLRCGYIWQPRASSPKQCPRCKRYDWKDSVTSATFDILKFEQLLIESEMEITDDTDPSIKIMILEARKKVEQYKQLYPELENVTTN